MPCKQSHLRKKILRDSVSQVFHGMMKYITIREELKTILEIILKQRDSPEPDCSGAFYETLAFFLTTQTETMIAKQIDTLCSFHFRDRPSSNQDTRNLLYLSDSPWPGFGSVYPRPNYVDCFQYQTPIWLFHFISTAFNPEH